MNITEIIENKKDNKKLRKEEIEYFVNNYTSGDIKEEDAIEMIKQIYNILEIEKPDIVIAETTVVLRNAEAQRNLTYILGAIIGKCVEESIAYDSFRPTEWRNKVKNKDEKIPRKREELKAWGKEKVFELYGKEIESDDIADSILLGRAYCNLAINL